jgi:hypothetical protein
VHVLVQVNSVFARHNVLERGACFGGLMSKKTKDARIKIEMDGRRMSECELANSKSGLELTFFLSLRVGA